MTSQGRYLRNAVGKYKDETRACGTLSVLLRDGIVVDGDVAEKTMLRVRAAIEIECDARQPLMVMEVITTRSPGAADWPFSKIIMPILIGAGGEITVRFECDDTYGDGAMREALLCLKVAN